MTNNKQQTEVEWLIEQLLTQFTYGQKIQFERLFEMAKERDKAEKIKFATDFFFWWYNQTSGTNTYEAVEKFYEQTYGGKK